MSRISRRSFLGLLPLGPILAGFELKGQQKNPVVMTVLGPIDPEQMGNTLVHEHILVDFIGAQNISPDRWNRDEVADKVLPYLDEAKIAGCNTLVDCTPNYLGRDVELLKNLSRTARINIITNTGYYGGSDHKFLPEEVFTSTANQLSARWIDEWKFGIDKTEVKPGFIKISVNPATLSEVSKKLVHAALLTHIKTGLTIASHTGPAIAAIEQIEIIRKGKVDPSAFIWVHAQHETDKSHYAKIAKQGAWVSLDGLNDNNISDYVEWLSLLKSKKCLHRVLVSHDAGWYEPGKPGGGNFRGYTTLFRKLIPALEKSGFNEHEVQQIIRDNPKNAFTIAVKRLKK